MKKVLYHILVVITFILMLPFAILATILWLYSRLILITIRKPCDYVKDAIKMPKWFKRFADYITYITDFTI